MIKGSKKISYNDLVNMPTSELKKKYKVGTLGLEKEVKKHLDGATPKYHGQMKEFYDKVYDK